jgi:hypothetical protein
VKTKETGTEHCQRSKQESERGGQWDRDRNLKLPSGN